METLIHSLTGELTRQLDIIDGPSKLDFITMGLGEGRTVIFQVRGLGPKIEARIDSVSIEDGSRQSWLISGYAYVIGDPGRFRFQGWFRTDRRVGCLKALEKN